MIHNLNHNMKYMNKKISISILGVAILLSSFLLWRPSASTAEDLPYKPPLVNMPNLSACAQSVANQIFLMRKGWQDNLKPMMDQEKPTSEITEDAFESLRTYRCWLDYLCETVLFSANQDDSKMAAYKGPNARPLEWTEIDRLSPHWFSWSGCTFPGLVEIPTTTLKYLPECNVGNVDTAGKTQANLDMCHRLIHQELAGVPEGSSPQAIEAFKDASPAYIGLERTLRMKSADQSIRPMQEKLTEILLKMQGMENHMGFLKNQIESLDKRLPCYIKKCD